MAKDKTNAMRILDRLKINYEVYYYDGSDGAVDGMSVAHKTGKNPDAVYKTLIAKGISGEHYCFIIPVTLELNLKSAAKSVGEKSVQMIRASDINEVTGYIRGGCSPFGMKKKLKTVVDSRAGEIEKMVVSGGRIGIQLELSTGDLISGANARLWHLTD